MFHSGSSVREPGSAPESPLECAPSVAASSECRRLGPLRHGVRAPQWNQRAQCNVGAAQLSRLRRREAPCKVTSSRGWNGGRFPANRRGMPVLGVVEHVSLT